MKGFAYLRGILIFFCLLISTLFLHAGKNTSLSFIGPTFSKHLAPASPCLNEFNIGFGAEFNVNLSKVLLGGHGYYMMEDSHNKQAFWIGLTAGYLVGKKVIFWVEPTLLIGGMKKQEYFSGKFSFFALPIISIGYDSFGFNFGYIPGIKKTHRSIVLFQLKIRIF